MPETFLQICISKNEIFFDLICPNLNIVMNGHFYKDLGKVKWDQTWPYVIVLYKYFTLTDKAMYLLQGRVSIKPINVTTK